MIQEASFEDFLSVLFIILIILIIFGALAWFIRLIFPFALQYFLRKTLNKMEQRNQSFMQENDDFYQERKRPKDKKIVGEYIDFEEIE